MSAEKELAALGEMRAKFASVYTTEVLITVYMYVCMYIMETVAPFRCNLLRG